MDKILGLIIASNREFQTIFRILPEDSFEQIETFPFNVYKVSISGKIVYTIFSGVGEILAASATQHLIDCYKVNIIMNYGVVGSLVDEIAVKNTVLIDKVVDYEYDTRAICDEKIGEHKDLKDGQYYEADRHLLELAQKVDPSLKAVICASGNKFIYKIEDKDYLNNEFGASICEMESAGISMVAYKNKIPTLFVKGVSDSKTNGEKEFNNMIVVSSEITYKLLVNLISKIDF